MCIILVTWMFCGVPNILIECNTFFNTYISSKWFYLFFKIYIKPKPKTFWYERWIRIYLYFLIFSIINHENWDDNVYVPATNNDLTFLIFLVSDLNCFIMIRNRREMTQSVSEDFALLVRDDWHNCRRNRGRSWHSGPSVSWDFRRKFRNVGEIRPSVDVARTVRQSRYRPPRTAQMTQKRSRGDLLCQARAYGYDVERKSPIVTDLRQILTLKRRPRNGLKQYARLVLVKRLR